MSEIEKFKKSISENSQAVGFNIRNDTLSDLSFNNTIIADCRFNNTLFDKYDISRLYDNSFENCLVIGCVSYKGEVYRNQFRNCHFINCNFRKAMLSNKGKDEVYDGILENSIFVNCDFTWSFFNSIKLRNVTFKNCKINQKLVLSNDCKGVKFIDCADPE